MHKLTNIWSDFLGGRWLSVELGVRLNDPYGYLPIQGISWFNNMQPWHLATTAYSWQCWALVGRPLGFYESLVLHLLGFGGAGNKLLLCRFAFLVEFIKNWLTHSVILLSIISVNTCGEQNIIIHLLTHCYKFLRYAVFTFWLKHVPFSMQIIVQWNNCLDKFFPCQQSSFH